MNAATITAVCTGAVAVIGAVTALVKALATDRALTAHLASEHPAATPPPAEPPS